MIFQSPLCQFFTFVNIFLPPTHTHKHTTEFSKLYSARIMTHSLQTLLNFFRHWKWEKRLLMHSNFFHVCYKLDTPKAWFFYCQFLPPHSLYATHQEPPKPVILCKLYSWVSRLTYFYFSASLQRNSSQQADETARTEQQ